MSQVVLPDPKGGDKDTVVFLDEAQAAPSPEEAQERGALAALARVAGHRNMQRLLPKAYEAAWEWFVKKVTNLCPVASQHSNPLYTDVLYSIFMCIFGGTDAACCIPARILCIFGHPLQRQPRSASELGSANGICL